ncbi:MAG: hypothetical protein MUF68_08135, partial [Cyclobacteriaceae bacterium]|nr:hypothetical protein [Cyclobacteriaceae bacterium]
MTKKLSVFAFLLFVLSVGYTQDIPAVSIDSEIIETEKLIKLNTQWAETNANGNRTRNVTFPHTWPENQATGYKKYELIVITNYNKPLALEIPDMYTSYRLWVNNQIIAQSGIVGKDAQNSEPEWTPKVADLPKANRYHITLEISNFFHSKGGIKNPILLGQREYINKKRSNAETAAILLIVLLVIFGIGINGYFWWTNMPASALYFSLLCIAWALRVAFSELYIVPYYFPSIPWQAVVHLEYISLFIAVAMGVQFVSSLYPLDSNKVIDIIFLSLLGLCTVVVLVSKP